VGRDLHEAERVRRLLPAQVAVVQAPSVALGALSDADVLLLEDRSWPAAEEDALGRLRSLSAARTLALVLSRLRGEGGERTDVPVVERPYRIDEVVSAVRLALLRRKG
jgi:hypothetical protein